jgi:UDP-N-acetylmuramoyl-L-alanyl-D-glutamate--2,6-diaminopimelate ligase
MTLRDLVRSLYEQGLDDPTSPVAGFGHAWEQPVAGLAYDSRRVARGDVFVGFTGERADGSAFALQAIARGAIAVVADRPLPGPVAVPWVHVPDGRLALAILAATFYDHPSRALSVTGITGTNGKTTTSYLVRAIHERAGYPCGLIGTVHYTVGGELRAAPRTTPEALDLQRLLKDMVNAGARACAMEVSSHALALRRVERTRFAAAVFTNLTRDHLDFHLDMGRYFAAKQRLFELLPAGAPAVVNIDDTYGATLAAACPNTVTYGLSSSADVRPGLMEPSLHGLVFEALTPAGRLSIRSRLGGRFNLYNLLAATATGVALNLPNEAIEGGLWEVSAVPGRFQVVSDPADEVTVIVDYAHTDDALQNVLEAVRPLATGRLITVFGCGGDRDRTKRPLMGAVASRLSDVVVITSDNPRSEDPEQIMDDIERGIGTASEHGLGTLDNTDTGSGRARPIGRWLREADRRVAIEHAVADAAPADVIVIAGKGHEQYQHLRDRMVPFDDVEIARAAVARRRRPADVHQEAV